MNQRRKLKLETVLALILGLVVLPLWTGAAALVVHEDEARSMIMDGASDPG